VVGFGTRSGDMGLVLGLLGFRQSQLLLGALHLIFARPAQRDAARHGIAHGAHAIQLGRRAVRGEARAHRHGRADVLELGLYEVGELKVVEEQVEEFFLGQGEDEIILAMAIGASPLPTPATARGRLGDGVADNEILVAGQHHIPFAAVLAEPEGRLVQAFGADLDFLAAVDLGDLALPESIANRLANLLLCPPDKALTVAQTFGLRIEPPVNDVHWRRST
jgi:hypothetical protein